MNRFFLFHCAGSPWPIPKLLYAYLSYSHSKSVSAVLITFYMWMAATVLIMYIDDGEHPSWFDGLGDFYIKDHNDDNYNHDRNYSYHDGDDNKTYQKKYGNDIEDYRRPTLLSVVVSDLIWVLMGISLGYIQAYIIENGLFYGFTSLPLFMAVSEWKTFYKDQDQNQNQILVKGKKKDNTNFLVKLGDYFNCYDLDAYFMMTTEERKKIVHKTMYWCYFFQLLMLGSVSTVIYTLDVTKTMKSGVIIYFIVQGFFLFCFYLFNVRLHTKFTSPPYTPPLVTRDNNNNTDESRLDYASNIVLWSKFNAVYIAFLFTLLVFCIPVLHVSFLISNNIPLSVFFCWCTVLVWWLIVYISNGPFYEGLLQSDILHSFVVPF